MPTGNIQLRALTTEQRRQYEDDGYIVLRRFLNDEQVAELRDTFTDLGKDGPVPGLSQEMRGIDANDPLTMWPRMMHPHRHPEMPVGPVALKYLLNRDVGDVMWDLFDGEPIAAQSMYYFKPAGSRGQDFHQDNFYLRVHPDTCMAYWQAVDPADEENGGLFVVPGSHKLGLQCPEKSDKSQFFTNDHLDVPEGMALVPVRLDAGDALFFNGSLIHGSYPNKSEDRMRRAFICHYVPADSQETAQWYKPLLRFNGEAVDIAEATGGGPCGDVDAPSMSR